MSESMTDEEKFDLVISGLNVRAESEELGREWPIVVQTGVELLCGNRGEAWVDPGWELLVQAVDAIRASEFNRSPYELPASLDLAFLTVAHITGAL